MKIELYYYDQCPFCQFVLRKIDSLNLREKITFKNTLENPDFRNQHIKATNRSTVPCLYIDGAPLFESGDINEWLEKNKSLI